MSSLHNVPSALIARNQSWVRQQAQALVSRLPANVERADLIQVGLIAVAQAWLTFEWPGAHDTDEAQQAFVAYARKRVRGAMIDELRQMDHLSRSQRRKVKAIQIARQRYRSANGSEPRLTQLSELVGMPIDEIAALERVAHIEQQANGDEDDDHEFGHMPQPYTEQSEVEARVDTGIVMRRLSQFFAGLPERERQVIDAYLGVGLEPAALAAALQLSTSRISQIYGALVRRIAVLTGHGPRRAIDLPDAAPQVEFGKLVQEREAELGHSPDDGAWGELLEQMLTLPTERFGAEPERGALRVTGDTRWG